MTSKQVLDVEGGTIHEVGTWTLKTGDDQQTGDVTVAIEDDDQISVMFGDVCVMVPAERIRILLRAS